MDSNDNPQVFYATLPGKSVRTCIDTAKDFGDGVLRSHFKRQTREEMALERGVEILVTDMNSFIEMQESSRSALCRWVAENHHGGHGVQSDGALPFGLNRDALRERFNYYQG